MRALNETLWVRIKNVETENRELRRQNEVFGGHVLQVRELEKQVQRLEHENQRLKRQAIAKSTQSEIEAQLKALGVRINSTLQKLIGSTPEEIVETAMQALKEAQLKGEVSNSGGFLYAAISDGWKPNENAGQQAGSAQFNEWWRWAYEQGLVKAATQIEGVQHVLTANDEWLPFETLRSAYPIDTSCPKPDAR